MSSLLPRLPEAISALRLNQRQFAELIGWDETMLSRLITGKRKMLTKDMIAALERHTGRSFSWLADLRDQAQTPDEQELLDDFRATPPDAQAFIRNALKQSRSR